MVLIDRWLSEAEEHHRATGRPLVSLCYAQSLDGSLTTQRGQPFTLSGPESLVLTHRLRAAHDAILVGIGTIIADDPSLTVRLVDGRTPQPVIIDSRLQLPLDARVLEVNPSPPWIATTRKANPRRWAALEASGVKLLELPADPQGYVLLPALLQYLGSQGISSLMVEGGARILTSFLIQGLADQVVITVSPRFLGGLNVIDAEAANKINGAKLNELLPSLEDIVYDRVGDDLIIWGKIR